MPCCQYSAIIFLAAYFKVVVDDNFDTDIGLSVGVGKFAVSSF